MNCIDHENEGSEVTSIVCSYYLDIQNRIDTYGVNSDYKAGNMNTIVVKDEEVCDYRANIKPKPYKDHNEKENDKVPEIDMKEDKQARCFCICLLF